jgi:hypothetical protein
MALAVPIDGKRWAMSLIGCEVTLTHRIRTVTLQDYTIEQYERTYGLEVYSKENHGFSRKLKAPAHSTKEIANQEK